MDKIITRNATVWDAQEIANMWEAEMKEICRFGRYCNDEEKERYFVSIVRRIKTPATNRVLVLENEYKTLVGFGAGHVGQIDYGYKGIIGSFENVYIKPEYRRGNLFKEFIEEFIIWAKALGAKQVQFTTNNDEKLIKFYKRQGYTPSEIVFRKEV